MTRFIFRRYKIVLFFFYASVVNASMIEKNFSVSTYIDKSNLYDYSLSLKASPEVFELTFNEDSKVFEQKTIDIKALTDIPSSSIGLGFNYQLKLITNESSCKNTVSDDVIKENFILLNIGGVDFTQEKPVNDLPIDQVSDENTLFGNVQLNINSKRIFKKVLSCTGTIALSAELAL